MGLGLLPNCDELVKYFGGIGLCLSLPLGTAIKGTADQSNYRSAVALFHKWLAARQQREEAA